MKVLILMSIFGYSFNSQACPNLQGRYNKCYSEIKKINGEYIVDQHQENNYEVYNVEYNDDETGQSRKTLIKTDNRKDIRNESLPKINLTVKIETHSRCEGNTIVSDANVFYLGMNVGNFVSKFVRQGKILQNITDGSYLGTEVHKRIICELE